MADHVYLAYDYPVLGTFLTMVLFFLWVLWLVVLFRVIADIFRDQQMSGWGKAGWLVFVLVLPFLGVFIYVIARGHGMGEREVHQAQERQQAFDTYIRQAAGKATSADELAKLSDLKARGELSEAEFQQAKEKVLH
jgi:hypothetical protein